MYYRRGSHVVCPLWTLPFFHTRQDISLGLQIFAKPFYFLVGGNKI